MKFIDTHCHLTDKKLENIEPVLERAKSEGIKLLIVPGTSLKDSRKVVDLVNEHDGLRGLVGIHPEEVEKVSNLEEELAEIERLLQEKNVVGLGEIGLDLYWRKDNLTRQIEVFEKQLIMAVRNKKPVVIHSRSAGAEIVEVLGRLGEKPKGQFHCFGENEEILNKILGWGFYVSFAGNVTYKNAEVSRRLVQATPIERLLLETDAPYLSPEPRRGEINEPVNVKIVAEEIARLKNLSLEELARVTTNNAQCLFLDIC